MPRYDYRCTTCGKELELTHRMDETVGHRPHQGPEAEDCDGLLERLISAVGLATAGLPSKGPSDSKLKDLGFTKYVRGEKGYEKAYGTDSTPTFINRE